MKTLALARHVDPYPEDRKPPVESKAPKTLDEFAQAASRATARWYGRVAKFNEPPGKWLSYKDWYLEHWRIHPATSPDAKTTIEHDDPVESAQIALFDEPH